MRQILSAMKRRMAFNREATNFLSLQMRAKMTPNTPAAALATKMLSAARAYASTATVRCVPDKVHTVSTDLSKLSITGSGKVEAYFRIPSVSSAPPIEPPRLPPVSRGACKRKSWVILANEKTHREAGRGTLELMLVGYLQPDCWHPSQPGRPLSFCQRLKGRYSLSNLAHRLHSSSPVRRQLQQ